MSIRWKAATYHITSRPYMMLQNPFFMNWIAPIGRIRMTVNINRHPDLMTFRTDAPYPTKMSDTGIVNGVLTSTGKCSHALR